mgnify:CR=1 FL=1
MRVNRTFAPYLRNIWAQRRKITVISKDRYYKKAFDKSGLIYGIGHAVYTISDPRAQILRNYVKRLAKEKECESEFELYNKIEKLAPQLVAKKKNMEKSKSENRVYVCAMYLFEFYRDKKHSHYSWSNKSDCWRMCDCRKNKKFCIFESGILHTLFADSINSIIRTAKRFREMKKLQF